MASIFDTARNILNNLKAQATSPIPAKGIGANNPINWGNVANTVSKTQIPILPIPGSQAFNQFVPKVSLGQMVNTTQQNFVQPFARRALQLGTTTPQIGLNMPTNFNFKPIQPQGNLQQAILGNKPIVNPVQDIKNISNFAQQQHTIPLINKQTPKLSGPVATAIAPAAYVGLALGDLFPLAGGGGKQGLKQIAERANSVEELTKFISKDKGLLKQAQTMFKDSRNVINNFSDLFNTAHGMVLNKDGLKFRNALLESGKVKTLEEAHQKALEYQKSLQTEAAINTNLMPQDVGKWKQIGNKLYRVIKDESGGVRLDLGTGGGKTVAQLRKEGQVGSSPNIIPQIDKAPAADAGLYDTGKTYATELGTVPVYKTDINSLYAHGDPELQDTIKHLKFPEGGSRTKEPIYITQHPNGKLIVMDGQHRVVEALQNNKKFIDAVKLDYQDVINPDFKFPNEGINNLIQGGEGSKITDLVNQSRVAQPTISDVSKGTDLLKQSDQIPVGETISPAQTTKGSSVLDNSSTDILSQPGKLNVQKLNVTPESRQAIRNADITPKTTIGNQQVIDEAKLTYGRKTPMTEEEQLKRLAIGLNSREKVVSVMKEYEALQKSGADEATLMKKFQEVVDQSKVGQQERTFAGRLLQSGNILADELATPQQKILALLDNAGVSSEKYLKDAVNVDWNNSKQVVNFYRKYVPGKLGDYLTEFRYTNMLSSPLTHIVNTASNLVQSAVIAPVEKTISGALDFAKSTLTGSERQYYVSDGIKYAKGYYGNLPEAVSKFKKTLLGQEVNIKPDMERIPVSTNKAWSLFTTPLKALEASDQFFMSLVKGGETASLQGRGLGAAEIASRAENSAKYRLFRQKFDPTGELGNGYLLRTWDKYNSVIKQLRRAPGGNWIVPFLQTPTNLLKQGIEYSPLGLTTIPGSARPIEQLSKTIIGSTVFMGAYGLLNQTPFTWAVPTGKKERELFYAANMQPYSVKIGDKWVSYSKLGPLSYPMAMAAALRYAEKYDLPNDNKSSIGTAVGGMLQFFSDQSYVKNIGDFIDSVQTGQGITGGIQAEATNLAGQLVPYKSFLGWLSRMIDPVNRKPDGMVGSITSQLPILSKDSPAYYNPVTKQPSQRSNPILNSFSPYRITTGDQAVENRFNYTGSAKRAYTNIMALPPEQRSAMFQKIRQDSPAIARGIVDITNEVKLGITGEDKAIKNLGTDERAYTLADKFNKLKTREEKSALWKKYLQAKIITPEVAKQLVPLLQK